MTDDELTAAVEFYAHLCARHPDPDLRLSVLQDVCVNEVGDRRLLRRVVRQAVVDAAPAAPGVH
jgi:hypothetical protein